MKEINNKENMKKMFFAMVFTTIIALIHLNNAFTQSNIDEAKMRFKKGLMFVDEGDCKKALVEFEEAYKLYQSAAILYNMALCYDNLHQYGKAMKYYKLFLEKSTKIPPKQEEIIQTRIKKFNEFLGTVSINCNIEGASVIIDGEIAGTTPMENFYLETGTHNIVITKENYEEFSKSITLVSGKTETINVNLLPIKKEHPQEEKKSSTSGITETEKEEEVIQSETEGKKKLNPVIFYSMIGVTVALGAGAGVIGGLNISNHNKFLDTPYSEKDEWKKLKDRGELYNILFVTLTSAAGASLVATAALAFFTDFKKKRKEESVKVSFTPILTSQEAKVFTTISY